MALNPATAFIEKGEFENEILHNRNSFFYVTCLFSLFYYWTYTYHFTTFVSSTMALSPNFPAPILIQKGEFDFFNNHPVHSNIVVKNLIRSHIVVDA